MEKLFDLIIWTVIFGAGYLIGSKEAKREIKTKIEELTTAQVRPGVVRHLSDEEIRDKHDPAKRGNLEAFNEFFKKFPVIGKLPK